MGLGAFWLAVPASFSSDCSGSQCLAITDTAFGKSCGTPDSIDVYFQNVSTKFYLKGYIVFATSSGPLYEGVGLLKPGEKGTVYRCHATGVSGSIANTGTEPASLRMPERK